MSREIKFRAYVKDIDQLDENEIPHKGNFIYGNLVRGDKYDFITSSMHMLSDGYTNFTWQWMIKKGSAEQFTGLKDIDDQEAYEGDIVSLDPDEPPYQIIFTEGKFEIVGDGIVYDLGEEFMDCKIIGNVHTDSDLIDR